MAGRDEDAIAVSEPIDPVSDEVDGWSAGPTSGTAQPRGFAELAAASFNASGPGASQTSDLPPNPADGADARRGEEGDAGDGGGVLDTTQHKQLQRQEDLSEKYYEKMIGHGEHSHINVSKVIAICRHKIAQDVLLEQFVGYLLFIVLFSICVLLQRNPAAANGVAAALKNRILATPFRDDGYELKTWSDIRSVDDWWDWHATVLMDTFYVDEYYSGTETSMYDQQKVMQHIKLIDGIRITQRRVLNGTCLVDNRRFSMFLSHCYGPTAADGRVGFTDKTGFTGAATGRLYSYQEISAFEGGYYAHLGGGGLREASRATLEGLRRDRWLNAGTSWVRTDFGAFNANVGLFSAVVLQMAIAPSGSVSPTFWVESLPYQPYATTLDYVRLTLECIFMASLLVFVAQEAQIIVFFARQARWERDRREGGPGRFMRRDVLAFLGNFWCVFDCHLLLGMMACVGLRAYIVLSGPFDNIEVPALTAERPALAVTDKDGTFLDVTQLALASWLYSVFCGLIVGGSSLKIVRFLRANVPLSVLTQTFVEMGMEVMLFFAILTLILTIWAAMAVTLFGSTVSEFRDLAASWQTCYLLFIGVTSREDVFRELPTDEFRGLPVEADIFFYPFTLVMTFVILNVSTGIIMTSYTKVTHNFDALQRHSLIDVLVQRAFTDQLSDAYLVWKIRARLRVASFERNVLALCRRHSAETLARPDVEYISDEQLLGIMHKVAMAATAGEGYDEALANVESIHMNPDSGLFPQYLDPKLADLVPHHIVVPASLVVKMAARENIGTELIAGCIDKAKAFTPDPATCTQAGENSAAGQVRIKEALAEGAAAVVQRVKLVAADIKRTSAKLDLVLAVLDTGEYEAHNEDVRDEEGNVI